ncbi:NADP-dependent oxidoreductase [Bradyrhizobium sp. KBS0727]|uniref:NADP-dependent oxidoreductase n=1 Tax=unclassified Bradyrhizobium TaxID=2631580 RepID=UPI00110EFF09|nr:MULTISPECIES: NADP-dependent oxidoreductase [unclassified Bradyrhizobium]QDW38028.1 NADP-dependent oxidoreductase [Bradyrhizobium sp. KBS0725]QDW44632.1 NADP-dependent oxidoreductase [Bradyrhizobium sp. KBS0727]
MDPYRQVVLAARPRGLPRAADFCLQTGPMPDPLEGQVLVATKFLSLDPYMRGRMNDAESNAPPVNVGGVMEGEVVAEVVRSRHPSFSRGELVQGRIGWRTHAAVAARDLQRVDTGLSPPETSLGVLGMPGFTAYAGLRAIGQPKPGETVVVSSAAGAVGSVVGQLAQLAGARAVGIAGGAAKCAYVRDELRFDAVVDHKARGLSKALAAACPDGIDVYFENVGGPIWKAVLPLLNRYARVPVCGLIAHYNGDAPAEPNSVAETMLAILRRSLLIRGFINTEFAPELYRAFRSEITPLVHSGRIRYREHVVEGLEAAPQAFIGMLEGHNFGKTLVRVS